MADVVVRDVRFNVQRLGHGPRTVVFIHGITFDNLSSWYLTAAPALAGRASLVLYDLRGHGRSEQPDTGYTLEDSVLDLAAILDAIDLESSTVTLAGNSYGGLIALAFALRFPERVESLFLVDAQAGRQDFLEDIATTLELEGEERDRTLEAFFGEWLDRHRVDGGMLAGDGASFGDLVEQRSARRRRPTERIVESLVYDTSLVEDVRALDPLSDEELARIECPVMAVYGADSNLRCEGERLARVLSDCRLEIVPGVQHFVLVHAAEFLRGALAAWIDGLALAVPSRRCG